MLFPTIRPEITTQTTQKISKFALDCFTIVLRARFGLCFTSFTKPMATLKAVVLKHQLRGDKTYNIKIRVTHERQSAYISTEHYIGQRQITADCKRIKDEFILAQLDIELARLRKEISKLGTSISLYSARTLAEYLAEVRTPGTDRRIDFFAEAEDLVNSLKAEGRDSTSSGYKAASNNLRKWIKRPTLEFKEITVRFLKDYELYLRSINMGSRGIESNLVSIRGIFNFARDKYNDEDLDDIRIKNYPFSKYKIPKSDEAEQRSLSVGKIRKIRDYKPKNKKEELSRDVYLLSFYLVGMNAKDLFYLGPIEGKRIVYNRAKTKRRRADNALISILIEPEAREILERNADPDGVFALNFYHTYANERTLNTAVNKGLKDIGKALDIKDLEFYSARHSWATIARNDCNISKDDISLCLNHRDLSSAVTDKYITKDWSRIDKANKKVIRLLNK